MLINGKNVTSEDEIPVLNPYNQEVVDTVPSASQKDVKNAIQSANKAKIKMKSLTSREVSENLYEVSNEMKKKIDEFSKMITLETGKPIKFSREEAKRAIETFKLSAEEAKRIYGETIPLDACRAGEGHIAFTIREPLGVVAAITPFNYPLNLAAHKVGPAIAAKNTVVLKPSLKAPLTAIMMGKIIDTYFPDGVINVITGNAKMIGDEFIKSDLINKITFTGGLNVGKKIAKSVGLKKLTLELGGNDPLIVLSDADIDKAVEAAVKGSYLYSGQVCIAVKRIIVENEIADEFSEKLVKETKKLKIGDPMDPKTDIGPLIDLNSAINVEKVVKDAVKNGAELLYGGNREKNLFEPTVLDYVTPEMKVVKEETFGPVSPIIRVKSIDEAVKIANDTCYALQAGVFTENIHKALELSQKIEAGAVIINKQSTFRTDNMPFGGFKCSGIGKEGVKYAVNDMTREKLIIFAPK